MIAAHAGPPKDSSRRRAAAISVLGGYATTAFVAVQGLILVPLYLHFIGPRLYGVWLASGDILGWLSLLQMGSASLLVQRVSRALGGNERDLAGAYYATGLAILLFLSGLVVVGALFVAHWFPGWMRLVGPDADLASVCFIVAAVATAMNIVGDGVASLAQAVQEPLVRAVATVCAGILGLATTIALLFLGRGLWAIPVGMLVRNGSLLAANIGNACWLYRGRIGRPFRPTVKVLKETGKLSFSMFGASFGNALLGRSEAPIIAIMLRPELATVYVLTRRGADVVRMLINQFNSPAFAGFSHLVGAQQRQRAWEVHREILRLYVPVSTLLIAAYLALNQTFMAVWVGKGQFGGSVLTILIALGTLVGSRSAFLGFLLGASGELVRSNVLVLVESMARLPLMIGLLAALGLPGIPLAALLTALVAGETAQRWTREALTPDAGPARISLPNRPMLALAGILFLGAMLGLGVWAESWPILVAEGCFVILLGALLLARFFPGIAGAIRLLRNRSFEGFQA